MVRARLRNEPGAAFSIDGSTTYAETTVSDDTLRYASGARGGAPRAGVAVGPGVVEAAAGRPPSCARPLPKARHQR